ncbi:hypothetical protein ACIRBY_16375 [Streptomyces sp. NPDC096136]|uniref:hypothetical protein n=1 Tax=Streptomyces sp. NPDC096136 TaxID=3366076 RepID=UPI003822815A
MRPTDTLTPLSGARGRSSRSSYWLFLTVIAAIAYGGDPYFGRPTPTGRPSVPVARWRGDKRSTQSGARPVG